MVAMPKKVAHSIPYRPSSVLFPILACFGSQTQKSKSTCKGCRRWFLVLESHYDANAH